MFVEFQVECFWWVDPSFIVRSSRDVDFVAKNLSTHGGRVGFMLAGELRRSPRGLAR